jgi:hypothetical protein
MEKSEQLFVIKFFFLKELSPKKIHRELYSALGWTACSLSQVRNWCTRSTEGVLTRVHQSRAGRPRHMLGTDLSQFLEEFPFATVGLLAQHFAESKHIIKEILNRELGLRMFSRR